MHERFTDRARKVMQLANQESQSFNHEYIGTEHVLLGLVKEGSGVAAHALKRLDVDLQKIRLEVEKIVQSGPDRVTMGKLPQTPRAKKVIEYSLEASQSFNHNYVGTEHLLLGLLREQEGVAAQVLMNLGLKLDDVREEVLDILNPDRKPPAPQNPHLARMKYLLARPDMTDDELLAIIERTLYGLEWLWHGLRITRLPSPREKDAYDFLGPEFRATGPHSDLPA